MYEALFGGLAQVDVADRASHAECPAGGFVAQRNAARHHPLIAPVGQTDTVLHHELRAVALDVGDQLLSIGGRLVGMQPCENALGLDERIARFEASDFAKAGRHVDAVGKNVPIPQAVVGTANGQCIALFAGLEALGGRLQLADARLQVGCHDVEVARKLGQFVAAFLGKAMIEATIGDRPAAAQESPQIAGKQVADTVEQDERQHDLCQRDQPALMQDRFARRGKHRYRYPELHEADLVPLQKQRPPDMNEAALHAVFHARRGLRVGHRQARHLWHSCAQHDGAIGVADAHVDQALAGFVEKLAEDILQLAVATLRAVGSGHGVEHRGVLLHQGAHARGCRLVHEASTVGEQQAQQHDLNDGAGEKQTQADREVLHAGQHCASRFIFGPACEWRWMRRLSARGRRSRHCARSRPGRRGN